MIMKINLLQFLTSFALIGIIVCVFIPNTESSPLPRSSGGEGSHGEGSSYGGHSSYSGSFSSREGRGFRAYRGSDS